MTFQYVINELENNAKGLSIDEQEKAGAEIFNIIEITKEVFEYFTELCSKSDMSESEAKFHFINKLDAALIKIGIDIAYIQKTIGVEFKPQNRFEINTRAKDLSSFLKNSTDLAKYYIGKAENNEISTNFNGIADVSSIKENEESKLLSAAFGKLKEECSTEQDKEFEEWFGNRLDAFALKNGIDLNVLQDKTLIPIKSKDRYDKKLRIKDVAPYLGGEEMAKYYIETLPEQEIVFANKKHKKTRRGRKKTPPFVDLVCNKQKERKLKVLHKNIDGKTGKEVVRILKASADLGWLNNIPRYEAVKNEFGNIGSSSGYNSYNSNDQKFSKIEIEMAKKVLLTDLEQMKE